MNWAQRLAYCLALPFMIVGEVCFLIAHFILGTEDL